MAHRPDEHHPRTGGNLRDHVQQALIFRSEFLPTGLTLKRRRHAVTHQHHRRLGILDLLHKLRPAFIRRFLARLQEAQAEARFAHGRIATPTKIAEGHVALREPRREHKLDPAVGLLALDQRVAKEYDAVAIAQLKRSRLLRRKRSAHCNAKHQGKTWVTNHRG